MAYVGWLINYYLRYIISYTKIVSMQTFPFAVDVLTQARSKDMSPQYSSVNSIDI